MKLHSTLAIYLIITALIPLHGVYSDQGSPLASRMTAYKTCGASSIQTGTTDQTIQSGGLTRNYRLHIPPGYDGHTAIPLLVSIHGLASNATQQEMWSQWTPIADRETFIVVYPNGIGFPQRWNAGIDTFSARDVDDVAFFNNLFDYFDQTLCIDDARIFVTGLSNGGGMANRLACEMAGRVAALGTVAGAYSPLPNGCQPVRPVPVIAFHGDADPLVNYNGSPNLNLPPIKEWVAGWVQRNGCKQGPDPIVTQGDVSGVSYTDCEINADVQFYTIAGGGHTWPGGVPIPFVGKMSRDINASETMWTFFKAHAMPPLP